MVLDRPGQGKCLLSDQFHCVATDILGQIRLAGSSKTIGAGHCGKREKERKIGINKV